MADLEKEEPIVEEPDSLEKFAQEYQDATYQRTPPEEPEEPVEPTPEEPVEEPVVEEVAPVEPEPVEEPAKDAEPVDPEATPPDETDPQQLYTVPDSEMYGDLRGKRATAAQLEEAGILNKILTRDHQEMHHTKLYQDLKKKFDADLDERLKAAGIDSNQPTTPAPEAVPVDVKASAEEIERNFAPALRQLAEAGSFEPDFVEAYPKLASHLAHQFESMRLVGQGLVKAVSEIKGHVDTQVQTTTADSNIGHLHGAMEGLAAEDKMYAPLADSAERNLFTEWMRDPNNEQPWKKMQIVEQLARPEILRGAYAAFRTATRHLRDVPGNPPNPEVRDKAILAGAGGGNARPVTKTPELNEFDQLKAEIEQTRAGSFGR